MRFCVARGDNPDFILTPPGISQDQQPAESIHAQGDETRFIVLSVFARQCQSVVKHPLHINQINTVFAAVDPILGGVMRDVRGLVYISNMYTSHSAASGLPNR